MGQGTDCSPRRDYIELRNVDQIPPEPRLLGLVNDQLTLRTLSNGTQVISTNEILLNLGGTTVNLKSAADNVIGTTANGQAHILSRIILVPDDFDTVSGVADVSVGTNDPTYDNLMTDTTLTGFDVDSSAFIFVPTSGVVTVIDPLTEIKLKVNSAGSGSTYIAKAFVLITRV